MYFQSMPKFLISLICALFLFSFSACVPKTTDLRVGWGSDSKGHHKSKGGPPPHAPAHGYRAKHNYRYYPDAHVYFDIHRKAYFHLEGDHWRMSVSLPRELRVQLGGYVSLEMESDKPYTKFKEHKQKYPSGKKNKKKKWSKQKH